MAYLAQHRATVTQERVLRAPSEYCTAALGGHLEACDGCGHRRAVYHSCRNRHSLHPHLHCVVTGGMLSADAERFEKSRSKGFLFPVRALTKVYRKVYRDKFLDGLRQAFKA